MAILTNSFTSSRGIAHQAAARRTSHPETAVLRMSSGLIRGILGSLARDVRTRPLLRLLELGAMASSSALARAAVCLNASRILPGRDSGDERQNHNDDPGHRCRLRARQQIPVKGHMVLSWQATPIARAMGRRCS